jgi:hypothetical protein
VTRDRIFLSLLPTTEPAQNSIVGGVEDDLQWDSHGYSGLSHLKICEVEQDFDEESIVPSCLLELS